MNRPELIEFRRTSYSVVRVLPELIGKTCDAIALGYIHSCRASSVRFVYEDESETTGASPWRVTVRLKRNNEIFEIEQEVEVGLPEGVGNGYELRCHLNGVKPPKPDKNGILGFTNFPNRET